MIYSNKNHQKSILKSHQYYHSSQNTHHLNKKKIFIHLLLFIRYNSKLSISCQYIYKEYIYNKYIYKEKRKILESKSHRPMCWHREWNVRLIYRKSLTITRQREKEKIAIWKPMISFNYVDRSADLCITSVVDGWSSYSLEIVSRANG